MCRNIKPLFNFEPPATQDEIDGASLQFVRKISGFTHPSQINQVAFDQACIEVAAASRKLLRALVTTAAPHDRETEARKAHERAVQRFGK